MKHTETVAFGVEALEPVVAPLPCYSRNTPFVNFLLGVATLGLFGYYLIVACL